MAALGIMQMANYYLDEQPYCLNTTKTLPEIADRLTQLGFILNWPLQHDEGQILSGHLFYADGHQLHIRVFQLQNTYGIKAHYEYAPSRPIRHIICTDLNFDEGGSQFNQLWNKLN